MKTPRNINLSVSGMSCGGCEKQVAQVLGRVPGVSSVSVSLLEKLAIVHGENLDGAALVAAVEAAGFGARALR